MTPANEEKCAACKFWRRVDKNAMIEFDKNSLMSDELDEEHPEAVLVGTCQRFPPRMVDSAVAEYVQMISKHHHFTPYIGSQGIGAAVHSSMWPVTWEFDWCGEFKVK